MFDASLRYFWERTCDGTVSLSLLLSTALFAGILGTILGAIATTYGEKE